LGKNLERMMGMPTNPNPTPMPKVKPPKLEENRIAYVLIGTVIVRGNPEDHYIGLRFSESGLEKLIETERKREYWIQYEIRVESPDLNLRGRRYRPAQNGSYID